MPTELQVQNILNALAVRMDSAEFDAFMASEPNWMQLRAKLQTLKDEQVRQRYDPTNPYVKTGNLWNGA